MWPDLTPIPLLDLKMMINRCGEQRTDQDCQAWICIVIQSKSVAYWGWLGQPGSQIPHHNHLPKLSFAFFQAISQASHRGPDFKEDQHPPQCLWSLRTQDKRAYLLCHAGYFTTVSYGPHCSVSLCVSPSLSLLATGAFWNRNISALIFASSAPPLSPCHIQTPVAHFLSWRRRDRLTFTPRADSTTHKHPSHH